MNTGEELKAYREKKLKLTRQQFSDISLIPVETLRSWEVGRRKLRPWHSLFLKLLKDHFKKSNKI